MTDLGTLVADLPLEQQAIKAKCFHPGGTFIEFSKEEVEQSIPARFERIVRAALTVRAKTDHDNKPDFPSWCERGTRGHGLEKHQI